MDYEVHQILDFIDLHKIKEISREYFENDHSVQALIKYLYNPKFTAAWKVLISSSEIEDILEWMGSHGVNIESEIIIFAKEAKRIPSKFLRNRLISGFSLNSFQEELQAQINFEELDKKIEELLEDGNDLAHLYLILSVTQPAIENIFAEPEIEVVLKQLRLLGIDIDGIKSFLYKTLRWN